MCDKLVFDLAQEIEGSPSVFVRKDWLNILDNQNQNYNNNQSVIDTSQLSNSNKWMNYREAYLSIPMLISIGLTDISKATNTTLPNFTTALGTQSIDYAYGLKNWFGSVIHSFTLDYNGTTIIQQTPLSNMWNSFKLLTSLSYGDLLTQGDVIGFYPDDATSWEWCVGASYDPAGGVALTTAPSFRSGTGVCNNTVYANLGQVGGPQETTGYMTFNSAEGNEGLTRRIQNVNFNPLGEPGLSGFKTNAGGTVLVTGAIPGSYQSLLSGNDPTSNLQLIWKSYVSSIKAISQQTSIVATVYLKHIHSFFNMVPLLKGVFMKMTMNLNNATSTVSCTSFETPGGSGAAVSIGMICSAVSVPTGGVNPLMISSPTGFQVGRCGSDNLFPKIITTANTSSTFTYTLNLSIGSKCLSQALTNSTVLSANASAVSEGVLSKSIYLYIPAYTFNPPFESSYLQSPVKVIKYTDIYQYQVLNIASGQQFNNLVTNGIANIKSILILPYYSATTTGSTQVTSSGAGYPGATTLSLNTGLVVGQPVWQSPFDPAGTGPTSPLCFITNFNVQVSGQNAIYNVEKYSFEQFNNQLYGQNSVNGGLTDGLTSGLIGRTQFDMEYCYYYVNVERMLPVEETVPKSIQILGNNLSSRALDLYVFIEYGMEIKIDAMTGARV